VAIFPDKQSTGLKNMEFDDVGSPILFYKILQELDKTHRAGIIHQDIKYGNILVNAKSEEDIF
jgi:serine/threonine protein kinase